MKISGPLSYAIRVGGGQEWKHHLDHIHEGPSVQSSDPEIETNGPLQVDVYLLLPIPRPEAESQVTTNQPTVAASQSQSDKYSSGASPPGGPSVTVRHYSC